MGLYQWRNRLLLDLPFRIAQHDAANDQSLNVGREGSTLDAGFGAGAAEPSKLDWRRGYYFDNNDHMICSTGYQLSGDEVTVLVTFGGFKGGAADYLFSWQSDTLNNTVAAIVSTATQLQFYTGSVAAAANSAQATLTNFGIVEGKITTVAGLHDGTNTSIYIDGEWVANAGTPLTPSITSYPLWIGARTNDSTYYDGNIYHVGMCDFALSPQQIKQYHNSMLRRMHQV